MFFHADEEPADVTTTATSWTCARGDRPGRSGSLSSWPSLYADAGGVWSDHHRHRVCPTLGHPRAPGRSANSLAVLASEWLQAHSQPTWLARYRRRVEDDRLPKGEPQRQAYARAVGLQ